MPRKGPAPRRELVPDPVYRSVLVTQLVNKVLLSGKKTVAERAVYEALDIVGIDFSSTADISRISELGGNVTSPYNWGALIDPPLVTSKTGSDIVIETDCSATICDNAGSQPHTLIYDASCASNVGGPWLDTTTQACRGE